MRDWHFVERIQDGDPTRAQQIGRFRQDASTIFKIKSLHYMVQKGRQPYYIIRILHTIEAIATASQVL